jgi:type IV pilus assembly protein PilA
MAGVRRERPDGEGNGRCTLNPGVRAADNPNMPPLRRSADAGRLRGEGGFTLIELLVVIVIMGILAGIALPAFLSQKEKANDSAAKSLVRTAQTAAEAFSTDHGGTYAGINVEELQAAEPTLKDKSKAELILAESVGGGKGFLVEAKAVANGDTYGIERTAGGEAVRTCAPEKHGGCAAGGTW